MSLQIIQHRFSSGLESSLVIPGVNLASQDIIFADPPYNFGVKYEDDPSGDKRSKDEYGSFVELCIHRLNCYLRPGGTLWWLTPPIHLGLIDRQLTNTVGPRLYLIIKQETFAQYQQKKLTEDYRLLFCHQRPGPYIFNADAIRTESARQAVYGDKRADARGRVPGQVWNIRRLQGTSDDHVDWHPAQLPPELLERIVLGWSNPGGNVLDAFAGSGNMGLVCKEHGRNFVGVDASPTYCQKMKERLGL